MSVEQTVLVVDDTEANVDILVDALADDFDIAVAMDGESALEILAEDPVHLVLLDVMMPGMDGWEVCEKIKADPATSSVPVIFLSGKSDPADKKKGLGLGAVDFIAKPFNVPDVIKRVKDILE